MRLVTGVAKHALGMRNGVHLRETLGLGGVLLVATPTEVGYIGQLRPVGRWVVGVFGQRAVTGLTVHARMLAALMRLGLCIVTKDALALAGVSDRPGADHVERAGAIVSVFPKILGDYHLADDQKEARTGQQD